MYNNIQYKSIFSILLFSLFIILGQGLVFAQGVSSSYDYQSEELSEKSRLSETLKEKSPEKYDYRNEKEKEEEQEKEDTFDPAVKPMLSPEMRAILKYSLFGLVILVLSFIVFRLVAGGLNLNNKKVKLGDQVYSIKDIEEKLHEVDVEAFLKQALAQQDYRLAIRLYYLAILKELSLAGHIEWKRDKTNGVYLREMRGHQQQALFRKTTYIYEYVWFNEDEAFGAHEFEEVRPIFKKLLTAVQPKTTNA